MYGLWSLTVDYLVVFITGSNFDFLHFCVRCFILLNDNWMFFLFVRLYIKMEYEDFESMICLRDDIMMFDIMLICAMLPSHSVLLLLIDLNIV